MEDEQAKPPLPAIPVLVFAAIDVMLALFLLVDGGMTLHFWLILLIGLALAGAGFAALWRNRAS